jgi:hypothetical protein
LRNVSKNNNFEFGHNLKWYIIRNSFERVLRNIQKKSPLNKFMNNAKINYIMLIIIISLKLNWIYNTNCPKHLNFFIVVLFMQLSNHCLEPVNIVSAFRLTRYREPPGLFGACLRHSAMLSSILSSVAFLWHLIQASAMEIDNC